MTNEEAINKMLKLGDKLTEMVDKAKTNEELSKIQQLIDKWITVGNNLEESMKEE